MKTACSIINYKKNKEKLKNVSKSKKILPKGASTSTELINEKIRPTIIKFLMTPAKKKWLLLT